MEQIKKMPEKIYVTPKGSGTVSGVWVDMKMDDEPRGEFEYIRADIAASKYGLSTPVTDKKDLQKEAAEVFPYNPALNMWSPFNEAQTMRRHGYLAAARKHSVTPVLSEEQKKNVRLIHAYGLDTRVWGYNKLYGYGCAECCNGDRCDEDCTAKYKGRRRECPHCKGHGWIKEEDATPITNQLSEEEIKEEAEKYAENCFFVASPFLLDKLKQAFLAGAALTAHPKQHTDDLH